MSYCRNCGNELEESAKFCNHCGTKVLEEQEIEYPQSKSKGKNNSNGSIFDFVLILLTIGVSIWVYNVYLGVNWFGKAVTALLLVYPQYIIGLILFIFASIRIYRKYRNLLNLKVLALTNLVTVVGLHLILFMFSSVDNQSNNESISLLIDLYLIAMIIFNIYVVIKYSVLVYRNGFKILIGR